MVSHMSGVVRMIYCIMKSPGRGDSEMKLYVRYNDSYHLETENSFVFVIDIYHIGDYVGCFKAEF